MIIFRNTTLDKRIRMPSTKPMGLEKKKGGDKAEDRDGWKRGELCRNYILKASTEWGSWRRGRGQHWFSVPLWGAPDSRLARFSDYLYPDCSSWQVSKWQCDFCFLSVILTSPALAGRSPLTLLVKVAPPILAVLANVSWDASCSLHWVFRIVAGLGAVKTAQRVKSSHANTRNWVWI